MPRFGTMNSNDQDSERAQLIQAYMVLHSQQTSVRRRLSRTPSLSPSSSVDSDSSPEPSPTRAFSDLSSPTPNRRFASSNSHSPLTRAQRSPFLRRPSIPSIPEVPEVEKAIDSDEEKLSDINQRIKSTLTDLLNCESVKHDERMRSWVQTRLQDAQQTPTHQRRSQAPYGHRRISSASNPGWAYGSPAVSSPRMGALVEDDTVRKLSI